MLWAAFILGLLGSMHCIGMCGPIALALPLDRSSKSTAALGASAYNVGRIFTYASMGLLFGAIGQVFLVVGLQQWISIAAGAMLLIYVIIAYGLKKPMFSKWNLGLGRLKGAMMKQFKKGSTSSLFSIGVLNGLLPCGFVYFALVGAIAASSPVEGAAYMALFGLGTAPALFAMNLFGSQLLSRFRINVNTLIPYVLVIFGVLFILRGMSLGIPFISPEILTTDGSGVGCH